MVCLCVGASTGLGLGALGMGDGEPALPTELAPPPSVEVGASPLPGLSACQDLGRDTQRRRKDLGEF